MTSIASLAKMWSMRMPRTLVRIDEVGRHGEATSGRRDRIHEAELTEPGKDLLAAFDEPIISAARDCQALLEALQGFSSRHRRHRQGAPPKQESVHEFIEKIRGKIEQEKIDRLPREMLRTLVLELRAAKRRVGFWFGGLDARSANEWKAFVGTGLRRTYRQGKNLVWQLEMIGQENASDETWHELRKCAKALGYQLRLLRPIWPGPINALLHEMDQLTDRLGDDHDLAVLRGRTLNEPYQDSETQNSADTRHIFLQSIDRRRKKLQLESLQLARRIYVEKPAQFEYRLASYWQNWNLAGQGKNTKNRRNAGSPGAEASKKVPEPQKQVNLSLDRNEES